MTESLLSVLVFAAAAVLFWRLRSGAASVESRLSHPRGWLSPARLDEALDVADRHLPQARAGGTVRLQYGPAGCLTLIRTRRRGGAAGFSARWEFWRPDRDLALRLLDQGAGRVETPQGDVLELAVGDDYPSLRKAVTAVFAGRSTERVDMHLTWNC